MVAELITQCPKCQTSFKVKDEQLKVANGLVRCGSCLHVFNAVEYSSLNKDTPVPPKLQEEDLDLSIDDLFEQDTLSKVDKNVDLTDDSVNEFISSSSPPVSSSRKKVTEEELLDISEDALSEDEELDADALFGSSSLDSDTFSSDDLDAEPLGTKPMKAVTADSDPHDEAWAEKLLKELEGDGEDDPTPVSQTPAKPTASATPSTATRAPATQNNQPLEQVGQSTSDIKAKANTPAREIPDRDAHEFEALELEDDTSETLDLESASFGSSYGAGSEHHQSSQDQPPYFESEPVYLSTEPQMKKDLYANLGWSFGCIIACLLIVCQIAWLNFASWSKLPEFRSGYAFACTLLDCKLPEIRSLESIRASNLIVKSDANNPNHLMIDAVITNQAAFSQPFPKLGMIFTDTNGQIIASGLITPGQYLGGELSGATIMEKKVPIHIAFKIKDPGSNARSYRLEFYP